MPAAAVAVILDGQDTTGAVKSCLVRLNVQVLKFPEASVAVSVIICVPLPVMLVPATGDCVTTIEPVAVQLSDTVARDV